MAKKIAEITMELACGGMIKTYLPCKDENDLLRKLKKRYKDGWGGDFGHFRFADEAVMYAGYKLHDIN